jgi:hypothetical protein
MIIMDVMDDVRTSFARKTVDNNITCVDVISGFETVLLFHVLNPIAL